VRKEEPRTGRHINHQVKRGITVCAAAAKHTVALASLCAALTSISCMINRKTLSGGETRTLSARRARARYISQKQTAQSQSEIKLVASSLTDWLTECRESLLTVGWPMRWKFMGSAMAIPFLAFLSHYPPDWESVCNCFLLAHTLSAPQLYVTEDWVVAGDRFSRKVLLIYLCGEARKPTVCALCERRCVSST
jgi:hypothetical protein